MKKIIVLFISVLLISIELHASSLTDSTFIEKKITLKTKTGKIYGTLMTPKKFSNIPVALIIAGSGPTDRDGNNAVMKNDGLKKLAYGLCKNGIASLRFDKRGIGESKDAMKSEADIRFDNYIDDAQEWIKLLKSDKRFSKVVVIGHSEGSLIGMIAAQTNADLYVSIAGAGRPADEILKEQLSTQPESIKEASEIIIDSLKAGYTVKKVSAVLLSLFRPSIQPYLISWFKYDPAKEISKLKIPVLIIQGDADIQITTEDSDVLYKASKASKLVVIENMNHIFRIVEGGREENIKTYYDASLPIAGEMVKSISEFIINGK
jgi:alpha/beta superfamily hydrolase